MKKAALVVLITGILTALLTYVAYLAGFIGVKSFFKLGLLSLGMMVIAAGYFLVSFLLEWAKETVL